MQTTREETWLYAAAKRVVLVIGLIILLLLSAMALFETTGAATPYQEDVCFSADHPLLGFAAAGILGILCAALVFWIVPKQIQTKAEKRRVCLFMLLICAAELGLCAAWLWNGNYLPGGTDMGKVYSAACLIAEDGNFAFVQETYFRIYPFQTGGALFFATIFQLLGSTDYRILLALNGLSALLCVYLNYKIADLAFGNVRVNVLTMFCTAAFFPMVFLTSMIYGDLPSWVLCWLSVWLTMKALKGESADLRWLVPVPFCLLLANVIRGVALLWCLSIGIVLVVYALGKRYRSRTRVLLLAFAVAILAAGLCSGALLHRYVEFRSGYSLDKGTPKSSWIAMGLQEGRRSCGGYNPWGENVYTIYSHYDYDVANVKNIQNIKRSLSGFAEDPGYALYFFHNKLATEWADPTYQSLQVDYYEEPEGQAGNSLSRRFFFGKEKNALIAWLDLYQNVLYLAALLGVALFLRKDHQKLEELLPLVVFLAGFWFYLIWETRARYVTPFVISLIPVAAYGLCRLFEQISHIKKKAAVEKCKAY